MMMMHQRPTVYIPTMSYVDDVVYNSDDSEEADSIDAFSSDEFRMYEFKIRRCARARSHDWTECPFAHPGEKARRRDPRKFHYSGTACPDFRKGNCKRGDSCDMAHGVFECWLHPARYRTQPCKDGTSCRRRVCFFAHTPEQLRVLATSPKTPLESYDGSPMRKATVMMMSSPPMSPTAAEEAMLVNSMRKLRFEKVKSMPTSSSGGFSVGYGSPRLCSLPSTPTRVFNGGFEGGFLEEREESVERVESGRALRAKMYERLCKESALLERKEPDFEWVSDLLK